MWHVFACFLRFRFIMYLVLALFKVALVNFTLNKYMMMMQRRQSIMMGRDQLNSRFHGRDIFREIDLLA